MRMFTLLQALLQVGSGKTLLIDSSDCCRYWV